MKAYERLLSYVKVFTPSSEETGTSPSTQYQFDLARLLVQELKELVQRILSNCYIDLSDFSSAALSSIAVATATPHSSALQLKKSSCVNIAET